MLSIYQYTYELQHLESMGAGKAFGNRGHIRIIMRLAKRLDYGILHFICEFGGHGTCCGCLECFHGNQILISINIKSNSENQG